MPEFIKKIEKIFLPKILFVLALVIYFIFGFHHLTDFISADEHFWLPNSGEERIEDYWKAVADRDWKDTQINDKPGITLAWTSGIAMLFDDAKGQIVSSDHTFKQFDPARTKRINFLYRLPILLISGFFSIFFFWIIKKITGDEWIALFSAAGMLLSPILIGISQIVNPDSLFWIFGSASLFSFYAFLQFSEKKFVILASVFLGLGLASKYVSIIFIPFFFFATIVHYFFEFEKWKEDKETLRKTVIRNGLIYLAVLFGGFLIFALMMPASFVKPKIFYQSTIGFPGMEPIFWTTMAVNALVLLDAWLLKNRGLYFLLSKLQPLEKVLRKAVYFLLAGTVVFVLLNWMTRNSIIDLSDIPFDTKRRDSFSRLPYYKRYIMQFVPLVFSLTPVALFSLLFIWIKSFFEKIKLNAFIFTLSSFFLIFYIAVIEQGLLVTVRYSIILFPFAMVLGAIAIREFFQGDDSGKKNTARKLFLAFLGIILLLFVSSTIQQNFFAASSKIKSAYVNAVYRGWYSLPILLLFIWGIYRLITGYFPWQKLKNIPKMFIFGFFAALNIISILLISPFYFSYTNELLPKNYIISGAWGYGGYEAAEYLNNLPDAKNLTVWADVYGVCEFFVGKCIHKAKVNTEKYPIDYYFRSLQATLPLNFPHPMEKEPVWLLHIDGRSKSFLKLNKARPAGSAPNQESAPESSGDTTDEE
jgi:4-amino-4-deoxy-L-arabinose transferase-like glycosyltransferase